MTGSRDSGPGPTAPGHRAVEVEAGGLGLPGDLILPADAKGVVVFAHGSGSSRQSPRNRFVARALSMNGFATLLFDLLTPQEELRRANVFDVELLGERLAGAAAWLQSQPRVGQLPVGYFGASTGAAAALWAAAEMGDRMRAVVSRGGRPDLAKARLADVTAPTLLIVGERDPVVIRLNREAQAHLRCENRLEIVPGATHLFEEPGTLERVVELALGWFDEHLTAVSGARASGPDLR